MNTIRRIFPSVLAAVAAALMLCIFSIPPVPAYAADCEFTGKKVNDTVDMEPAPIEDCILKGADPPVKDWRPGDGYSEGIAVSQVTGSRKAAPGCPATLTRDLSCSASRLYPRCAPGRPGGESSNPPGALAVCSPPTPGFATQGGEDPTIYRLGRYYGRDFGQCFSGFAQSTSFINSSDFLGSFTTNVNVSADLNVQSNGTLCAGGSVDFCGLSFAGKVCTSNENGEQEPGNNSHVTLTGGGTLHFGCNILELQGRVTLPDGGVVNGITLPPGTKLQVLNGTPTLGILWPGQDLYLDDNGQQIASATIPIVGTVDVQYGGRAIVPSEIITKLRDDSTGQECGGLNP